MNQHRFLQVRRREGTGGEAGRGVAAGGGRLLQNVRKFGFFLAVTYSRFSWLRENIWANYTGTSVTNNNSERSRHEIVVNATDGGQMDIATKKPNYMKSTFWERR